MSRYQNVYQCPDNLYSAGSPVILSAGALLKDIAEGRMVVQLKFKCVSDKVISAIKVSIEAFDVSGAPLQGVPEYQYLDLTASYGAEFGSRVAIPLPDVVSRRFEAKIESVVFADGTCWQNTLEFEHLPQQKTIHETIADAALVEQYKRDTSDASCYAPMEYEDLWFCSCGAVNKMSRVACYICEAEKEHIFSALDTKVLAQNKTRYETTQEEIRKKQEMVQAEKAKSTKKNLVVISIIAIFVALILTVTVFVPHAKEQKRIDALKLNVEAQVMQTLEDTVYEIYSNPLYLGYEDMLTKEFLEGVEFKYYTERVDGKSVEIIGFISFEFGGDVYGGEFTITGNLDIGQGVFNITTITKQ